jgi:hypothetical protein
MSGFLFWVENKVLIQSPHKIWESRDHIYLAENSIADDPIRVNERVSNVSIKNLLSKGISQNRKNKPKIGEIKIFFLFIKLKYFFFGIFLKKI